tara:strand:+ start:305 stop:574 length:270 start_codon:yes stop_codon:yes gene_type:complete
MDKGTIDNNLKKLIFFSNLISYSLSFVVLVLYFSFILILGFKPEFFHKTLPESSITYGIFSGLFIIIISVLLTFIYVLLSNLFLDKLKK